MEKYCMYLRKSRADVEAESRGECETLSRHEKTLLELAKKMNINVKRIYKEIVSGETISSRPMMQKVLEEVEKGIWDGVIVIEVERLARGNTIDQGIVAQTFQLSNTKIITPLKIYDPNNEFDEEYFEFGLFMSRREYKTINRRLQRGRIASVKEGKYVASQPPYGYIRKKIEGDKGFTLKKDPEQSKIVKLIFDLYTIGELQNDGTYKRLGTGLIANKLNLMNVPTKKGKDWMPSTIRDILRNPVYIGKIRWNWRPANKKIVNGQIVIERPQASYKDYVLANGIHAPIIQKGTFDLAQTLMSQKPPMPVGERSVIKNPLAGIVVCGRCNRKMVRRPYGKGKNQSDVLMCITRNCNNVSSALHYVEDRIVEALCEWFKNYKLSWELNNDSEKKFINTQKLALKKLEGEIRKTQSKIDKLHDFLEQGIYSAKVFLERSAFNSQKLEKLKKEKINIETNLSAEIERKKNIMPKTEKLLEVYKNLKTPKAKNDILKQVIEKVIYIKDKKGRWHSTPDDFEIVLYPKLPDSSFVKEL